jgi:hypothetical protein
MSETATGDLIELRVDNVAQLFHTLDPFPFRERDLDREAEEFIVGWARELTAGRAITIVIHLPETEAKTKAAGELKSIPGIFLPSCRCHSARNQRAVPDRSPFARDRRLDPGCLSCVGASRRRLFNRQPFQASGRGELSYSGVGGELAAAGNIPVRLVAARTATRLVSPACCGQR